MRLWMKVFIVILILMVSSTSICSIITLDQNRKAMIDQKINDSSMSQEQLITNISNDVLNKKTENDVLILSSEDIKNIISSSSANSKDRFLHLAVLSNYGVFIYNSGITLDDYTDLIKIIKKSDDLTFLCQLNSLEKMQCATIFVIDGEKYILLSETDMSFVNASWKEQNIKLHMINFLISSLASLVTIILILLFVSPISKINDALMEITNGNYSHRIEACGSYEFRNLIERINMLSESVMTNVNKIKNISEGRKQFVDNFAHEMKTPLTSIIGFSKLLNYNMNMSDDKRKEYASIIEKEAERLRGLSSKLLELSTVEHASMDFQDISLKELFEETRKAMDPSLAQKGCTLCLKSDNSVISVDKELFKSLLYNLIDNALKASRDGSEIVLSGFTNEKKTVIAVSDKGCGMTAEEVKHVLEPFYKIDKSRTIETNSIGLGLTLCSEIARQHNAILSIDSKLCVGTTVSITMVGGDAVD